jgi:hypothetical protein
VDFGWQAALSSQAAIFNISLTVFTFLFPVPMSLHALLALRSESERACLAPASCPA